MTVKEVKIASPSGLQVDSAGAFCNLALTFKSSIKFYYRGDNEANAKSVLSILGAGIRNGEMISIACDGPDEEEAAEKLSQLLAGE